MSRQRAPRGNGSQSEVDWSKVLWYATSDEWDAFVDGQLDQHELLERVNDRAGQGATA